MPMVLAQTLLPFLASTPLIGAVGFGGIQTIAPMIGGGHQVEGVIFSVHDPRRMVSSRAELLSKLGQYADAREEVTSVSAGIVAQLVEASKLGVEELSEKVGSEAGGAAFDIASVINHPRMAKAKTAMDACHPGKFDALVAAGKWPWLATGHCLSPWIWPESLFFTDDAAPIRPGDFVSFSAALLPLMSTKVFLGSKDKKAFFYAEEPRGVWEIDVADLTHVAKVTDVMRPGMALMEPPDVRQRLPDLAGRILDACPGEPFEAPKAKNALWGYDAALSTIWSALRELPA